MVDYIIGIDWCDSGTSETPSPFTVIMRAPKDIGGISLWEAVTAFAEDYVNGEYEAFTTMMVSVPAGTEITDCNDASGPVRFEYKAA
ncbi:hypothetical protein [Kitasatospora sp. NPDC056184]|uniref:hypothetical protein n=1 Tax=Kitasatospora sp. NPDC056184 TaxID=3345738 RepID=UPI0035DC0D08